MAKLRKNSAVGSAPRMNHFGLRSSGALGESEGGGFSRQIRMPDRNETDPTKSIRTSDTTEPTSEVILKSGSSLGAARQHFKSLHRPKGDNRTTRHPHSFGTVRQATVR